ncbi:hypothetical protein KKF91_14250, partial [Myxococcota bacterium]|nr:hypothetical protein [Myxococcota bacterium]
MSEDQTTQYLLREPLDRPAGPLSAENLCALILQGRVFGTDWVQIGANAPVQLQSLEVFHSTLYQAIGHEVQGAWSGQIHPVQVAELFGYIFNHKLSGYLIVQTNENAQKSITFKDGYPINAFSNVIGEDIKTYFINKGLLDENIYNQIISNQFSQCIDLYQAINQLAIDQSAFKKTLSVLTLTRVINLFSLKAGVWNFISAEIKETEEILSQIDIKNLIQTALSTSIDVNEATAALVPYSDQVFYVDSATSQHFAMDDVDQK